MTLDEVRIIGAPGDREVAILFHNRRVPFAVLTPSWLPSRSAVLHEAVRLLRASGLSADYEGAWSEWIRAGEAEAWEPVVGDGITS